MLSTLNWRSIQSGEMIDFLKFTSEACCERTFIQSQCIFRAVMEFWPLPLEQRTKLVLRQRLHGTGSVWNRYEIGTDKPCVYTRPGGSGTDRICYLVPNGSTYEGDPMWNRTVPV